MSFGYSVGVASCFIIPVTESLAADEIRVVSMEEYFERAYISAWWRPLAAME